MRPAQILPLIIIHCLFVFGLAAQPGSVTQKEVDTAKKFIEAKQAVLLGNFDEAVTRFGKLLEDDPENDVLHYELGRIYYVQEETQDAVDELEKAFKLNPEPTYAGLLGELYEATGQYREGAELFKSLVDSRSSKVSSEARNGFRMRQALFYVKGQEIDKAIDIYDELEKQLGVTAEMSRRKHALYLGSGDKKRAEKELLNLIDAFPDDLEYRHLLAGYYNSQGEQDKTKRVYQEILRVEPNDVRAQLAFQDTGRSTETPSANDGELMALMSRTDVDLDLKIGRLLPTVQAVANTNSQEVADEVLPLVEELIRVHSSDAKPQALKGDLLFHSGRLAEAAEAYRLTLELDETVYPVWEQYLHALYLDNQLSELRTASEAALDLFPNRPFLSFYAALGEVGRGDFAEATGLMDQAVFIFGAANTDPATTGMARTYQRIMVLLDDEKLPKPEELPDFATPSEPLSLYLRARTAAEKGNFQTGYDLLRAADTPRNTNATFLELFGDLTIKTTGDKSAAASLYERAKAAGSTSRLLLRKINETKS